MPKPIADALRYVPSDTGGTFLDEAADKLAELVMAVNATGKGGKIMMEISVKKMSKGACGVIGKVKLTKPTEAPDVTLMFPTEDGDLLTEDPRQQKLELKRVETGPVTELKVAGGTQI